MPEVAIIAALRHEVGPAVRGWRVADRQHDNRLFRFYESPDGRAVLVCGGIGPQAARRACEAAIALFRPEVVVSAGFAGALRPGPKIGQGMSFSRVIDATDGSTMDAGGEEGVLLSFPEVVSAAQKAKLAQAYAADAVDMEAAAVARGAAARGVEFLAFKAISDGPEFEFPQFERFIRADGSFRTLAFVGAGAARPWLWPVIAGMARNSARARETLCSWLEQYNRGTHETVSARCALRPSGVQAKR